MKALKFKKGDRVAFKSDVEGTGIVAEAYPGHRMYAIRSGVEHDPPGYQFHPMAVYSVMHHCMVVWVDERKVSEKRGDYEE
jgi:hypothetical protein